jgi:hypothetical protein
MKTASIYRYRPGRLGLALFAALCLQSASGATLVEQKFDVLKTRTGTYTNVTVTTKADRYVFILHANGMTNIKITDLPADVQRTLGYAAALPEPDQTNDVATVAARGAGASNTDVNSPGSIGGRRLPFNFPAIQIASQVLYTVIAILVLAYLFTCYCLHQICVKANSQPGLLIWIPGFQLVPLFRAAEMAPVWYLAMLAPAVAGGLAATGTMGSGVLLMLAPIGPIAANIVWCINIVRTRGKAPWLALLLILPITSLFAMLYLAFSSAATAEEPRPKYKSMALQTA